MGLYLLVASWTHLIQFSIFHKSYLPPLYKTLVAVLECFHCLHWVYTCSLLHYLISQYFLSLKICSWFICLSWYQRKTNIWLFSVSQNKYSFCAHWDYTFSWPNIEHAFKKAKLISGVHYTWKYQPCYIFPLLCCKTAGNGNHVRLFCVSHKLYLPAVSTGIIYLQVAYQPLFYNIL